VASGAKKAVFDIPRLKNVARLNDEYDRVVTVFDR
jgi:hypothetical protein